MQNVAKIALVIHSARQNENHSQKEMKMHILAERVPSENPNIQTYEVKHGGGILKEAVM